MNFYIPLPGPFLWWFLAGIVVGAVGSFFAAFLWIGQLYLRAFRISDSGGLDAYRRKS